MSDFFRDPLVGWVALVVVLLPLVVIGAGEVEERLRQRDSGFRRPMAILRTWVLPFAAAWAVAAVLLDGRSFLVVLLGTLVVLGAAFVALTSISVVVERLRTRPRIEGQRQLPRLILALPRLVVLIVAGWVLIAGVWSVDLSAAFTALGLSSLVVSLALQDTLGGLASGFTLLADQPFQPGDWIKVGDVEGRVVDVNWRSSRLQTRDNDLVVIPNGQLATATIINFDEPSRLHRVVVDLQVAYSNAPSAVEEMLLATARATPGVLEDPPPKVVVTQIDDPLMGYAVHLWIDDHTISPTVKSRFGALVWYHSHRFDVPLPSPAQDLYLWDGDRTAAESRPTYGALLAGLRSSPLLEQLDDDSLDLLAGAATLAHFKGGETIKGHGGPGGLWVLTSGRAQLTVRMADDDVGVLDLDRGDLIGTTSEDDLGAHYRAVADCEFVRVEGRDVEAVVARSSGLTAAIEQIEASRRRRIARALGRALTAPVDGDVDDRSSDESESAS